MLKQLLNGNNGLSLILPLKQHSLESDLSLLTACMVWLSATVEKCDCNFFS